jgi:hypothetical protein
MKNFLGIAWLAVEGNPILFEILGLSVGKGLDGGQ